MIKNFNFYDIYGYFLPGLVLVFLGWVPLVLVGEKPPASDLSSAIVAIALAYIVGVILQIVARNAWQSSFKFKFGEGQVFNRYPSDLILDSDNKTFSTEFKTELSQEIAGAFKIHVGVTETVETLSKDRLEELGKRRNEAALLCRSALLANKAAAYAEQFEGMYTLMRGMTTAFCLGVSYFAGLAIGSFLPDSIANKSLTIALVMSILAIISHVVVLIPKIKYPRFFIWAVNISLAVMVLFVGVFTGKFTPQADAFAAQWEVFLLLALMSTFIALICLGSFKHFTNQFAIAIYRDFYNFRRLSPIPADSTGAPKTPKDKEQDEEEDEDGD